jgi:hypothetical protein
LQDYLTKALPREAFERLRRAAQEGIDLESEEKQKEEGEDIIEDDS